MMDRYIVFVADGKQAAQLEQESSHKLSMEEALHEVCLVHFTLFTTNAK